MTLQIIGTKKSSDTRKAVRFCKERSIPYQLIDLQERMISPGELSHVLRYHEAADLIDTTSKFYQKQGYSYLDYDPVEEILEHHELLVLPIIRMDRNVLLGFDAKALMSALKG